MADAKVTASVSLKTLLIPSKTVAVEYPGLEGFTIDVSFLSRETVVGLRKKATITSRKGRENVEELDDDLFLKLYVNASIKGWKGLKVKYLEKLVLVDVTGQDPEAELPYDQETALMLMKASTNFDGFISDQVTELGNFSSNSK